MPPAAARQGEIAEVARFFIRLIRLGIIPG